MSQAKGMIYLFDWGNTLMKDDPHETGPMSLWDNPVVCDHAVETLALLSRDHRCCLATNARDSNEADIWTALHRVGLGHFISAIFCFRSLGLCKPSPAFFTAVCEALSCSPSDILMVGDDPRADYAWARENGARALLYDPGGVFDGQGYETIGDLLALVRPL